MKQILTITLFLIINVTYAQYSWTPAEVHLKNGTVLKGEAKVPQSPSGLIIGKKERARFRKAKKQKKQKIDAKDISYITFRATEEEKVNGKKVKKIVTKKFITTYLRKKRKNPYFVELLVDGKVKLLARTVTTGNASVGAGPGASSIPSGVQSHNQMLVVKGNDIPEVFNNWSLSRSFKKRAIKYFKDCSSLVSKLENKTYKKKDLEAIVKYYNNSCTK